MQNRLKEAINWYCSARIDENNQLVQETKQQGRRDLGRGLIVAATILAATGLIFFLLPLPDLIRTLFGSFIILTLWVVVWTPVDTLFNYWRLYAHEARLFQNLREAELVVESDLSTNSLSV
jgi:hypothetical protein